MPRSSKRSARPATTPTGAEANPLPLPAVRAAEGRDLVFFYSRLTQTLENACGADALAERLADSRRSAPADPDAIPDVPAIGRALRRLGIMRQDQEAADFIPGFAKRVAEAVSRSERHVLTLLRLLAVGDEKLDLKAVCGPTPQCGEECRLTRECDFFNNPRKPAVALMTPVERLLSGNDTAMSDAELLSVCLYGDKGTGREPVVDTLLARYGRLRAIFRADPREYEAIRGMTRLQAVRLASQSALYRRLLAERRDAMQHIDSAKDIYDRYAAELREYRVEAAVLLMLDQRHNVIRDAWFTGVSPNAARIGIADLLRPAVREYAVRIALVHNHPSDNPAPSEDDRLFTRMLCRACRIFGLFLIDHVIVTESGYYSFSEAGLLGEMRAASDVLLKDERDDAFWDLRAPEFLVPEPAPSPTPADN